MNTEDRENTTNYKVVVNHEEQYSIWPADRENPLGWHDVGRIGMKSECLAYIKEVWTDMRPLSLRKSMEEAARKQASRHRTEASPSEQQILVRRRNTEDDIIKRLSEGDHRISVSLRPEKGVQALKECIEQSFVRIKFMDTRGGTELGFRLDPEAVDLSRGDFDTQTGNVHLVGRLTLNYVEVQVVADIDLKTLTGTGHFVPVKGSLPK